jgi:FlhB-like protein
MREYKGGAKRLSVALRYLPELPAPFIIAKGEGRQAERLIALAREAGLPVVQDRGLVEALYPIELGSCVPEEFYVVVAKVFAFIRSIEET